MQPTASRARFWRFWDVIHALAAADAQTVSPQSIKLCYNGTTGMTSNHTTHRVEAMHRGHSGIRVWSCHCYSSLRTTAAMRCFCILALMIILLGALGGCSTRPTSRPLSQTEQGILGTWVSEDDREVFTFAHDRSFLIERSTLGGKNGLFYAQEPDRPLRNTCFTLEGVEFLVCFVNQTEFILNYGDGLTSSARWTRTRSPAPMP
jgi:hypothetical protein